MQRFLPGDLPAELPGKLPPDQIPACYFTRFEPDDEGKKVMVSLAGYPEVARAYTTRCIRLLLVPQTDYHRPWFLSSTQFWCRDTTSPGTNDRPGYHRFTLKVVHDSETSEPGLMISYDGIAFILKQSLAQLHYSNPDTRMFRLAAFRGRIYPWKFLPETAWYHANEIFPVLNREVTGWLGEVFPADYSNATFHRHFTHIAGFINSYCQSETFQAVVPHNNQFKPVSSNSTGKLVHAGSKFLFGEGQTGTNPLEGLKKYGPLQRPAGTHFRYFFIYFENQQAEAMRLSRCIAGKEGHLKINRLTCLPLAHAPEYDMIIGGEADAAMQVEHCLRYRWFDAGVTWYAFYISPYSRSEPDESRKQLYYRIKELLLHRQVSMQAVDAGKLRHDFSHALGSIACGMVVKLGGIPWLPEGKRHSGPVVGLCSIRRGRILQQYAGISVRFSQEMNFCGFDLFPATDPLILAGRVVEALLLYLRHFPTPRQMVIHTNMPLNEDHMEPMQKMLAQLQIDIPVVMALIRQASGRGLMVFGNRNGNAMPENGTWIHYGDNRYLLNINARERRGRHRVAQNLPLRIRFRCTHPGYLASDGIVPEMLEQICSLSRMHWNPDRHSSLPVTVSYPAKLATFVPWFRMKMLPPHGRSVPWFL